MNEKAKVSREVAEFITGYEDHVNGISGWEDNLIAEQGRAWLNGFEGLNDEAICMREITPFQLAFILVNGYEVEQTPEEKMVELFEETSQKACEPQSELDDRTYQDGVKQGIFVTLEILNIKIKGVNDI